MSLEWMDGFDHYSTVAHNLRKWDSGGSVNVDTTPGRFGGRAASMTNASDTLFLTSATPGNLANKATRVVGFAALFNAAVAQTIFRFKDVTTLQCELQVNTSRQFIVSRNGTTIATSSATYTVGAWCYIEFKVTIDNAGSYEVRLNGTNILSGSADTQNTANAYSNAIEFTGFGSGGWHLDDMYLLNTDGSAPLNNFLGEQRIETNTADGDGVTVQWTPLSGSNFSNVDDTIASPDDDTTYNSETTVGEIDLYAIANFSFTGTVAAVQTNLLVRKDDAGSSTIREVCRSGGTNFEGSDFTPSSTYLYALERRIVDPNTGAAWDQTGINNAQFGIKLQS